MFSLPPIVAPSTPSGRETPAPQIEENIPPDPFFLPEMSGVKQTIRKTFEKQTSPPVSQPDLELTPFTASFMPKDPLLNEEACEDITAKNIHAQFTRIFGPRSHILDLNTLTHVITHDSPLIFDAINPIFAEISEEKEDFLQPEAQLEYIKDYCHQTLSIQNPSLNKSFKRSLAIKKLASLFFPYLKTNDLAKVKFNTDFICICLRLNEKIPAEFALNFKYESPFKNDTYSYPFRQLTQKLQKNILKNPGLQEVEELDLSSTYIETLPSHFHKGLTNLKKLNFQNNQCSSLSLLSSIAQFSSLEELDLSNNELTELPPSFFDLLPNLKSINLKNNKFNKVKKIRIMYLCNQNNILLYI